MSIDILGPFIGHTTDTTTKIWLRKKSGGEAFVTLFEKGQPVGPAKTLSFTKERLWAAMAPFDGLKPDTEYTYKIAEDREGTKPLDLGKLDSTFLKVTTMPGEFNWNTYRYDFMLLSCHNPDLYAQKNGGDGYEVWKAMPQVLSPQQTHSGKSRVLFALMGGDQVYADDWRNRLLDAKSVEEKIEIYFQVYERYWSNPAYREVLCSLPAYLMWDDHDIMDGWGSELESFKANGDQLTDEFKPEWQSMFVAAKRAFRYYQADRNPEPESPYKNDDSDSFDACFRIGPMGFVMADLRSHRNWQKKAFWTPEQVSRIEKWIQANRTEMETLFFLTPVVIAHGSPKVEEGLVANWPVVLKFFKHARDSQTSATSKGVTALKTSALAIFATVVVGLALVVGYASFWLKLAAFAVPFVTGTILYVFARRITREQILHEIDLIKSDKGDQTVIGWFLHFVGLFISPKTIDAFDNAAGDLRDDIRDSWGDVSNAASTERLLRLLFEIQNDEVWDTRVYVAILSGDIHAGGYSNIYSSNPAHKDRPVIPHIVSSPVGYTPFPWFAEAFYRAMSIGRVDLGSSKTFYAQNFHHFTNRNFAICSVRKTGKDQLSLKAKFYLEGYPEPQTAIFDLDSASHREEIKWDGK